LYFVALDEWGIIPEYINEHWSPEVLWLMFRERKDNIRRLEEMREKALAGGEEERREVSDLELFKKMKLPGYTV